MRIDEAAVLEAAETGATDVADLLERAARGGTPLYDPRTCRATFLWRARPEVQAVHLRVNRVTEKDDFERGLMRRVGQTGWWIRTLELAPTLRASYGFVEYTDPAEARPLIPGEGMPPVLADPHGAGPVIPYEPVAPAASAGRPGARPAVRTGHSVFSGPLAPAAPEWDGPVPSTPATHHPEAVHPAATTGASAIEPDGEIAGVPLFRHHPGSRPEARLLLFDAEDWFLRLDLPRALAVAGLDVEVIGVGHRDRETRMRTLRGNTDFLTAVLDATVADKDPAVPLIVAGQSLGGLSALLALLERPGAVDAVIAQSPSVWWWPGRACSPRDLDAHRVDWLAARFTAAEPQTARVVLGVGTREGLMLPKTHTLAHVMAARGWDARVRVWDGGHDLACWRHDLIDALLEVLDQ
ncbi:hypothetical protein CFRA_03215 [Corynebacterium frankenforstense DSM 45800]|uniref:Enterochelin esterase N-terminal domain-containing protein n=1 Tax=Corynebacterium frankenforstense DSM 45800 TaxID=1437875 RepID=A0A1L7CRJ3_9CORY|nr:alpha/beta hydrolase-fold protein [Corynebacterium frankenforstense]APT88448.1 hypothetical protein CFRA_03215 [Corynebacterium frankenforstense DSM 45800]